MPELQVIYICCSWAAHVYALPLKYLPVRTWSPVMTADYRRPSSLWRCDKIPQENQPATWQVHTIILLPWSRSDSTSWLALPATVLCPAPVFKRARSVRFIVMRTCCLRPRKPLYGKEDATMGTWLQNPLLLWYRHISYVSNCQPDKTLNWPREGSAKAPTWQWQPVIWGVVL